MRIEEIYADGGATVRRIANYVGKVDLELCDQVYAGLYGDSDKIGGKHVTRDRSTWFGNQSSWKTCDYWDEELWQTVWGPELEKILGY